MTLFPDAVDVARPFRAGWRACGVGVAAVGVAALGLAPAHATTFGPIQVIECPGSDAVRLVITLHSGNTFGAVFWSDGFRIAPGLPDLPQITRCTSDGPIFWVDSARVRGEITAGSADVNPGWLAEPAVRSLDAAELHQALALGLGDTPQRERYLRLRAWWADNASHRGVQATGSSVAASDFPAGSPARANLEALAQLFDETDPGERLMKAEALRELGRFDEARSLLPAEAPSVPGLQAHWALLTERLAARDARVARFPAAR